MFAHKFPLLLELIDAQSYERQDSPLRRESRRRIRIMKLLNLASYYRPLKKFERAIRRETEQTNATGAQTAVVIGARCHAKSFWTLLPAAAAGIDDAADSGISDRSPSISSAARLPLAGSGPAASSPDGAPVRSISPRAGRRPAGAGSSHARALASPARPVSGVCSHSRHGGCQSPATRLPRRAGRS